MESTKEKCVWHSGKPSHVGWWNASWGPEANCEWWRWWDGRNWSWAVHPTVGGNCAPALQSFR